MHILHVLPLITARAGGPVAFVAEGAEALNAVGVASTIFSTALGQPPSADVSRDIEPSELPENVRELDLHLFPVQAPRRLAFAPSMGRRLHRVAGEFDLIHIHSLWLFPQFAAYWAADRSQVPYVVSLHGALDPYLRQHGRARKTLTDMLWQRRMLANAALLHITTEQEGDLVADVAVETPRHVVPVGVWTERFQTGGDGDRFRARYLAGSKADIVLFLGRLTYKKGLDLLIESFARVPRAPRPALLVIAGPDDEDLQPALESVIRNADLTGRVIFTGPIYQRDRADALSAATVWALSSYTENFGVAVMEALAAGLPTVVSKDVNLAGAIGQHQAGVVAETNPQAFGVALSNILADRDSHPDLASRARALAWTYDWAVVAPELKTMYRRALELS